jgi:transposase
MVTMPYIIEKPVGKSVYLYEVTSFWDPAKKQPRQQRTYLGKKDPNTGQLIRTRSTRPRLSKDYGNVYLLRKIAERIGLSQLLEQIFPEDYPTLLALACFAISEATPLYGFPYWVESTVVNGVEPLSSKALTQLTDKLGRLESERLEFCRHWIRHVGPVQAVVFDITSLSSYSTLFELVEGGYNRDHEQVPQINLGVIYAEQSNLPLYYLLYPGSIPDVSTLKNLLNYIKLFELRESVFVLDRGFYRATNLVNMAQSQMRFLLPLPRSVNLFSTLRAKHTGHLSNPANSFLFRDEVLFYVQDSIALSNLVLQTHLYFDPQSRCDQTAHFLKRILEVEAAAKQQEFATKTEARQYLASQLNGAADVFRVTGKTGSFEITRKPATLSQRLANMGTTIMLTNHPSLGREQILAFYRRKDYLEKTFDILKNECDGKRLRGSTKDTIEGRLFLKFISLILYSVLGNIMRDQRLFKRYSVREIMYELKKLRMVEMNNGNFYLTEVSKRQKEIFNKFDVEIPSVET